MRDGGATVTGLDQVVQGPSTTPLRGAVPLPNPSTTPLRGAVPFPQQAGGGMAEVGTVTGNCPR